MSMIHNSCVLLGWRSALSAGTARSSTVKSIEYSTQGRAMTASPIHSRRPALDGGGSRLTTAIPILLVGRDLLFLLAAGGAPRWRFRRPLLEMLRGAARADPMGEHRVRPLRHELFDRYPGVFLLPDVLAIGANRKQPLQLLHLRLQPEEAFGDAQARAQLLRVDGLENEVVGACL